MKLLLKLRHWQLFLISWGSLMAVLACLMIKPDYILQYFPFWFALFLIGTINSFAWVWMIVTVLNQTIAVEVRPKRTIFKICFWIPAIYVTSFVGFMLFNIFVRKIKSTNPELDLQLFLGLGLLSICCILYGLFFTAKTIRTAELQKDLRAYDYFAEAILMLLAPIGLWIIQPRINKLVL